jgi:hypothetical protein
MPVSKAELKDVATSTSQFNQIRFFNITFHKNNPYKEILDRYNALTEIICAPLNEIIELNDVAAAKGRIAHKENAIIQRNTLISDNYYLIMECQALEVKLEQSQKDIQFVQTQLINLDEWWKSKRNAIIKVSAFFYTNASVILLFGLGAAPTAVAAILTSIGILSIVLITALAVGFAYKYNEQYKFDCQVAKTQEASLHQVELRLKEELNQIEAIQFLSFDSGLSNLRGYTQVSPTCTKDPAEVDFAPLPASLFISNSSGN